GRRARRALLLRREHERPGPTLAGRRRLRRAPARLGRRGLRARPAAAARRGRDRLRPGGARLARAGADGGRVLPRLPLPGPERGPDRRAPPRRRRRPLPARPGRWRAAAALAAAAAAAEARLPGDRAGALRLARAASRLAGSAELDPDG